MQLSTKTYIYKVAMFCCLLWNNKKIKTNIKEKAKQNNTKVKKKKKKKNKIKERERERDSLIDCMSVLVCNSI